MISSSAVIGQSNNYNKAEVMEQITNLHKNTQNFIENNFNILKNEEVAAFMKMDFEIVIKKNYHDQMIALKPLATEAEMENLYTTLTEQALKVLLDKYSIKYQ